MNALAWREVRYNYRIWIAAAPLICLTTALTVLTLSVATIMPGGEEEATDISNYDAALTAWTLVGALALLSVTVDRAASRCRKAIARIDLAGLTPPAAMNLLYAQVVIVSLPSIAAGLALAIPFTGPATQIVMEAATGMRGESGHIGTHALAGAALLAFGVALISSTKGAQLARNVYPIEAIKTRPWIPRPGAARNVLLPLVVGIATIGAGVAVVLRPESGVFIGRPIASANSATVWAVAFTIGLACFLALTARYYCPLLIRAWTVILPQTHLPTMLLGRRGARFQATRSLEAFNLILVGSLLAGALTSVYYARGGVGPEGPGWVPERDFAGLVLAAGPGALAIIASIVTVVITARDRSLEATVLRVSGATDRQVLAAGFFEAFILGVTALAVAAVGVAGVAAITGVGMSAATGTSWIEAIGWAPLVWIGPLGVAVLGMALITCCSLPSVIRGLRRSSLQTSPLGR